MHGITELRGEEENGGMDGEKHFGGGLDDCEWCRVQRREVESDAR